MEFKNFNIKIEGLFGKFDYNLDLSGKLNILIGENGDGKSTVINIINNIFNFDFISLTSIKFTRIEIKFNEKLISINYDSLLAHPSAYFGAYTLIEDQVIKNAQNNFIKQKPLGLNDFENLEELNDKNYSFKKNSFSYVDNFSIKSIEPNSITEKLIHAIISKFSINEFNEYVSLVVNYEPDYFLRLFNQKAITENTVFSYIKKYFDTNRSKSFTHNELIAYIKTINKPYKPQSTTVNVIQNSYFLISSEIFNTTSKIIKNNNIDFFYGRHGTIINKLNMVEIYKLDSRVYKNRFRNESYLRKSESNSLQDQYNEELDESTATINMSIKEIYDKSTFEQFTVEFLNLAKKFQKLKNNNTPDSLESVDILEYERIKSQLTYKYDSSVFSSVRDFIYLKERRNPLSLKERRAKEDYLEEITFARDFDSFINRFIKETFYTFSNNYDQTYRNTVTIIKELITLFEKLWSKRLGSIKDAETILTSYLSGKSVEILATKRFLVKDKKTGEVIPIELLSSGEKKILAIFSAVILGEQEGLLLIDEPELSLSIPWQERLVDDISSFGGKIILATQSNHIARDKHSKNIVLMIPRNLK
jgi:predicted ATPase